MPSVPSIRANENGATPGFMLRVFGFEITRAKAAPVLSPPSSWGQWPIIREPFPGAWQRNLELRTENILTYHAVYACVTLIASDISKLRPRLVEMDDDGIWSETEAPAFSPVLRKPNRYQNRIKFFEQWMVSKLLHGNTYVLKERDNRGVVVRLYVLDPTRVRVLVAPDGSIYYSLGQDNLSGIEAATVTVPASEIIHDVMVPLYHPLCGVSPLTACGVAAIQGLSIQNNSARLFQRGARPSGILTAPHKIDDDTAERLKKYFEENFTGENAGRVAVVGDGLTYTSMTMNAVDAQLIEQLKWSAETVCSTFHVPPYMIGVGPMPSYNNIQALNQQYYAQALQNPIECIELCLDEGLGLSPGKIDGKTYGTEFDLDDLLRMDTATMYDAEVKVVRGSVKAPNEARKRLNLKPVTGGDSPLAQHQDYSLAALAKRDAKPDPFASARVPATQPLLEPADDEENPDNDNEEERAAAAQFAAWELKRHLNLLAA